MDRNRRTHGPLPPFVRTVRHEPRQAIVGIALLVGAPVSLVLAAFAALILLHPLHADAATVTVTVKTDTTTGVAANCPGASCSLRDAIAAAGPSDTITFAPALNGRTITLANGTLTLAQDVIIQGPGATNLAVDGGCPTCGAGGTPSGGVTVFTVNSGVSATISGLTIQHGNAASFDNGGGILDYGTALTVADCTFTGNSATTEGGGGIYSTRSTVMVTNSTITGNSALDGGGIYADFGTLTVMGSMITGNSATASNSLTAQGGGIYSTRGTLELTNSTVTGNSASGDSSIDGGGGLYSTSAATLTNTTVKGNTTTGRGGGIFSSQASLTMTGGTIGGLNAPTATSRAPAAAVSISREALPPPLICR